MFSIGCRPILIFERMSGRYSVQKTLWGRATHMGSKISLLVYQWPLILCKIWYLNGSIKNFPKFESKLAQTLRKFEKKNQVIFVKIGLTLYMSGSLFLQKLVFVWVHFQIPSSTYKNQSWEPPGGMSIISQNGSWVSFPLKQFWFRLTGW